MAVSAPRHGIGSAGCIAGAWLWCGIGRWLGLDRLRHWAGRHGRWLTLSPDDLDKAQSFFGRYCASDVLIGQLVPGVRTFVSVPVGIVAMPLMKFLVFSSIGTVAWTALLATAGHLLGSQYALVADWLGPLTSIIAFGLIAR